MWDIADIRKEISELENLIKGKKDNGVYGSIVERYSKCGKEGCKCEYGQKHGPYPVIQLYDRNGVAKSIYLGKKDRDKYMEKLDENEQLFSVIKKLNKLYQTEIKLIKNDNISDKKNIINKEPASDIDANT